MTLTVVFKIDSVKANHHAKYPCQRSFCSKVIVRKGTHTRL